jgi:hypothetical protein
VKPFSFADYPKFLEDHPIVVAGFLLVVAANAAFVVKKARDATREDESMFN